MRLSTLARHPLAIVGAVVTTASAVVFVTLLIAMLAGMFSNPYAGLVISSASRLCSRSGCCSSRPACHSSGESCCAIQRRVRMAGH